MAGDIIDNRKARHHYQILETYEAGLILVGTEVKALRAGHGDLEGSFARLERDEVWLYHCNIQPYEKAHYNNHEPQARRKLLLNRSEIRKLFGSASLKGRSLIPLKLFWKNGKIKVLLGVAIGKSGRDKRQDLKKSEDRREIDRAIKSDRK